MIESMSHGWFCIITCLCFHFSGYHKKLYDECLNIHLYIYMYIYIPGHVFSCYKISEMHNDFSL